VEVLELLIQEVVEVALLIQVLAVKVVQA